MVETTENREARLRAWLLETEASELTPPCVDPRVAALVALGVVDFAKSPEGSARFAELQALDGYDPTVVGDLAHLAETLLRVVDTFRAAPRNRRPLSIAPALDAECRARRRTMIAVLSNHASEAPALASALRRVDLAYGPMDLACDLRALAAMAERYDGDKALAMSTRELACKLEAALTAYDTAEQREAREALYRVWHVFEATYRRLAETGRELFSDDPEALFPTLEAIASAERSARTRSLPGIPASEIVGRSLPPAVRISQSRVPTSAARKVIDAPTTVAEVFLHSTSESNLWLGFSQDIAEGGVFVATYASHPLGAPMELEVQLPGRDETLRVTGVVQWVRSLAASEEVPPGVGVRVTEITPETARALQMFAASRTPLFYDE